jgi:bacillithiol system protein YtxJ
MGIFSNIFGGKEDKVSKSEEKSYLNWLPLNSTEQLEEIKQTSKTEYVFIFKHSTRCSISSIVLKRFEGLFKEEHQDLKVYYLDLLNYRNISDEIGHTFQVTHQSPQLIILKNGISVQNASHYDITNTELSTFI